MELLLASSNPHKVEEIAAILAPAGWRIDGLDVLEELPQEPEEDGETFSENARIKALAYARSTGRRCLADDSGLVVDALDGQPGVYSARFAGEGDTRDARDAANNARLIAMLSNVPPQRRAARFVCAMCVADPDGTIVAETEGTFEGVIIDDPRGENGFGYDPLLYLPGEGCTSAELSTAAKNARSHRGAAARAIVALLAD